MNSHSVHRLFLSGAAALCCSHGRAPTRPPTHLLSSLTISLDVGRSATLTSSTPIASAPDSSVLRRLPPVSSSGSALPPTLLSTSLLAASSSPPPSTSPGTIPTYGTLSSSPPLTVPPQTHAPPHSFALMLAAGVSADRFSFSLVLKARSQDPSLPLGLQVHAFILKSYLAAELYLNNCLIGFYSRRGRCELALQVFDRMPQRDSVSWNTMIDGYAKNGRMDAAKDLFGEMKVRDRNLVTWNTMIGCYSASLGGINDARDLFDRMPERDLISWNLIIGGYVKSGRIENAATLFKIMPMKDAISWTNLIAGYMEAGQVGLARQLFDEMSERDLITWNTMISGYVKNGSFVHALSLFHEMRTRANLAPDVTTLASALSAISELGRVRDGIAVHEYIERNRLPLHGKLGVGLIDMYSNCGKLEEALKIFDGSGNTVDHWNAMLGGLAIHGHGELALELFKAMERLPLKPDDITFIAVLNGCSHAGLVDEGVKFFEIMKKDCNLEPKVQHYGCMVDTLGRAGRLDDAWKVIDEMPMPPNDIIWRSMLSACRKRGDIAMGRKVAEASMQGGFCDSSSYVLLSNMYAGGGLWGDVRRVRRIMRQREARKIPGCSWIEVDGFVHEFVVGDISHPLSTEIYSLLKLASIELKYQTFLCED